MTNPAATKVKLWISGAVYGQITGYAWHTATVAIMVSDLLAIAAAPTGSIRASPFFVGLPPPEPDVGH
jgi:hypothetical protein